MKPLLVQLVKKQTLTFAAVLDNYTSCLAILHRQCSNFITLPSVMNTDHIKHTVSHTVIARNQVFVQTPKISFCNLDHYCISKKVIN